MWLVAIVFEMAGLAKLRNCVRSRNRVLGSERTVAFVRTIEPNLLSLRVMPLPSFSCSICVQINLPGRADGLCNVRRGKVL